LPKLLTEVYWHVFTDHSVVIESDTKIWWWNFARHKIISEQNKGDLCTQDFRKWM